MAKIIMRLALLLSSSALPGSAGKLARLLISGNVYG